MKAEDLLHQAQNNLDHADLLVDSAERRGNEPSYQAITTALARATVTAQMATALAILEQTEAIKANYRMAHEAINEAIAPDTKALWMDEQQRLADEHQGQTAAEEYDRSQTFRNGRRAYRVGETVYTDNKFPNRTTAIILGINHDEPGKELTVALDGVATGVSVWAVDPIEEEKP